MTQTPLPVRDENDHEVSALELFFDLVFVFAIMQLSAALLADHSPTGMARTLVLFVAVYNIWLSVTWTACLHDTRSRSLQAVLLASMIAGLFMNATITSAFEKTPALFVALYVSMNLLRDGWLGARSDSALLRDHFRRVAVWDGVGAAFWIVGVLLPAWRLPLWAIGAAVDLAGNALAHPLPGWRTTTERIRLPGERLLERGRLFFIIALGETVLTTGAAIAAHATAPMSLLAGLIAVSGTIALWWCYFERQDHALSVALERTVNPAQSTIRVYNRLFLTVAAMIAIAVADEIVIAHPVHHADASTIALMYGGPIVFFATQAGLAGPTTSRLAAIAALVVFGAISPLLPSIVALAGAAAPIIGAAIADTRLDRRDNNAGAA